MKNNVKGLTQAGVIACLYAVLTLMPGLGAIAYGPVQLRVSEALAVLPIFTPWAVPGLTVGCLIANMASPMALDMVFGTAATLLAAYFTYRLRNHMKAAVLMPAVFNGIIIGSMITIFDNNAVRSLKLLLFNMGTVALGELAVCALLGYPLALYLKKSGLFK